MLQAARLNIEQVKFISLPNSFEKEGA